MLGKPCILSLFLNLFNEFNKYEHSCKILYVFLFSVSELLEVSPEELGSALTADYTVARGR